jgi:hypothetical protein
MGIPDGSNGFIGKPQWPASFFGRSDNPALVRDSSHIDYKHVIITFNG